MKTAIDTQALYASFLAKGGAVQRIPAGKRALLASFVADIAHGDDDDRRTALERLADRLERKADRRAARKVRRLARREYNACLAYEREG